MIRTKLSDWLITTRKWNPIGRYYFNQRLILFMVDLNQMYSSFKRRLQIGSASHNAAISHTIKDKQVYYELFDSAALNRLCNTYSDVVDGWTAVPLDPSSAQYDDSYSEFLINTNWIDRKESSVQNRTNKFYKGLLIAKINVKSPK